jgi:hypothetical protein
MTSMTPWREGLAVREHEGPWWAWVVAVTLARIGEDLAHREDPGLLWFALGFTVAVGGGVVWQLLYRRDLVDRLRLVCWVAIAMVVLVPLGRSSRAPASR